MRPLLLVLAVVVSGCESARVVSRPALDLDLDHIAEPERTAILRILTRETISENK